MEDRERIATELLVLKSRRGDDGAFMELVRMYERRLFFYIRRMTGNEDDTMDALQKTWLAVFENLKKLRDSARFVPWVYRIARNTALSHIRSERKNDTVSLDDMEMEIPDDGGFDEQFDLADAEELMNGMESLSSRHREVLTLYYLEDFDITEIAGIVDAPGGTVKSRIYHAKRALAKSLKQGRLLHG